MLFNFGKNTSVKLTSSNSYSQGTHSLLSLSLSLSLSPSLSNTRTHMLTHSQGYQELLLEEYILQHVDVTNALHSNESLYLFGNNYEGVFRSLMDMYRNPPCEHCDRAGAKTIGIGGKNTGA